MKARPIQVECYAGNRADERPRRLFIDDIEHRVVRLLSATVEERIDSGERMHRYRVLTEEGAVINIVRRGDGSWYLESMARADER